MVCVLFSGVNLYVNVIYLPFYKPVMNLANVLHGCLFLGGTMFFSCAHLRGVPQVSNACPVRTSHRYGRSCCRS